MSAIPNNTQLNPGTGGDLIVTEDLGDGTKMPVSKIRLGDTDEDGGDVTADNPFPIEAASTDQLLAQLLATAQSLLAVSRNIDQSLAKIAGVLPSEE
jgi:hypothetical protein